MFLQLRLANLTTQILKHLAAAMPGAVKISLGAVEFSDSHRTFRGSLIFARFVAERPFALGETGFLHLSLGRGPASAPAEVQTKKSRLDFFI